MTRWAPGTAEPFPTGNVIRLQAETAQRRRERLSLTGTGNPATARLGAPRSGTLPARLWTAQQPSQRGDIMCPTKAEVVRWSRHSPWELTRGPTPGGPTGVPPRVRRTAASRLTQQAGSRGPGSRAGSCTQPARARGKAPPRLPSGSR